MEKIDIASDILRHDDTEIIAFLFSKMKEVRLSFDGAVEQKDPAIMYMAYGDVELVLDVLRKLNRRNEEKAVQ